MSFEDELRAALDERAGRANVTGVEPMTTIVEGGVRRRLQRRLLGGAGAAVLAIMVIAGVGSLVSDETTSVTIADEGGEQVEQPGDEGDPDTTDDQTVTIDDSASSTDDTTEPELDDPTEDGDGDGTDEPTETAEPSDGLPEGFGRYLVARAGAGDRWQGDPVPGSDLATRVIPVYDAPDGPKRMLLEVNEIDGVEHPLPLFNWTDHGSPTVLRVLDGEPGHSWVRVQAPTRPHDQGVWVRASDFHWAETTLRIEIDLADAGSLTVFDGSDPLLEIPIVQGRPSRPTPTHVTYLEAGLLTEVLDPSISYLGEATLTMASWSEELGTFGGGNSPINYLHGTNQPSLMGQRVSSGEIRLTDDDLMQLVDLVHPGVPIIMFDSSARRPGRAEVLDRIPMPAVTTSLVVNAVGSNAVYRSHPQLWVPCAEPARVCRNPEPGPRPDGFRYAIVRDTNPAGAADQVPVFDEPDGAPRTLLDTNDIDGVELANPLYPQTVYGNPLVLRVLVEQDDWIKVQVPTRPNHSHAWVRASDFEVRTTDVWIEIALAELPAEQSDAGELLLYRGDELIMRNAIVSGRETRPTPIVNGWVTQITEGDRLGPAYGTWAIGLGTFSEALGTFGGGMLPGMAIHGTNQPELIGQRVSSTKVRLPNGVLDIVAGTEGLLGAPAFVHAERAWLTYSTALRQHIATTPAETVPYIADAQPLVVEPS